MINVLKWETIWTRLYLTMPLQSPSTMPGISEFIKQPVEGDTSCPSSSPRNKHIQLLQRETTCSPLPHSCSDHDVTKPSSNIPDIPNPTSNPHHPPDWAPDSRRASQQVRWVLQHVVWYSSWIWSVIWAVIKFSLFCTNIMIYKNVM